MTRLHASYCPKIYNKNDNPSSPTRRLIEIVNQKGLYSLSNVGDYDSKGIPSPLRHSLPVLFDEDPSPSRLDEFRRDPCMTVILDKEETLQYLNNTYGTHNWFTPINGKIEIGHDCTVTDPNGIWENDEEKRCSFAIPSSLIKREQFQNNPSTTPFVYTPSDNILDRAIPANKDKITTLQAKLPTEQRVIIDSYKNLAYLTFVSRWKFDLDQRKINTDQNFLPQDWDNVYFEQFKKAIPLVGKDPIPNVSLYAHTMISPASEKPKSIADYSQEIECDYKHVDLDFYNNSEYDLSGTREKQTHVHQTVEGVVNEMKVWNYVQHGQGRPPTSSGGNGNGSHLHIKPTQGMENISLRTYRGLIGLFAPFFAGTYLDHLNDDSRLDQGDYKFRSPIGQWATRPPLLSKNDIDRFDDISEGHVKWWWITPHTRTNYGHEREYGDRHDERGSLKPLTFEFRPNEAIPQSSFTAVNIMGRIADAYYQAGFNPVWSKAFIEMAEKAISRRQITKVDDLKAVLTNDPITADIFSKAVGLDVQIGSEVNLKDVLKASLKTMPMRPWEKFWALNVLNGVTWTKLLRTTLQSSGDAQIKRGMNLTKQFLNYLSTDIEITDAVLNTPRSVESVLTSPGLMDVSNITYQLAKDYRHGPDDRSSRRSRLTVDCDCGMCDESDDEYNSECDEYCSENC